MRPEHRRPGVLVFGVGQVAEVFAQYLADIDNRNQHGLPFHGFVVDAKYLPADGPAPTRWDPLCQREYVALEKVREEFTPYEAQFVIGMSFRGLNKPRAEKFAAMLAKEYEPFTFIDRRATVIGATVGRGTFVMDGNTLQPGVCIGENCVLWSNNHVGHHTRIGDHVWISSGVTISGACDIGERCFIGSGATIGDNLKIGARCIIGAGATITSDCEDDGVYPGPAAERSKVPSSRMRGVWAA